MDLAASADALHEPANRIYEYYFLMQLFRRLRRKARLFPGKFDVLRLRGITSLRLFDDRITAYYCGFAGADDYYARAAAANVVDRIAVPALIIHAANDPFIRDAARNLAPHCRQSKHHLHRDRRTAATAPSSANSTADAMAIRPTTAAGPNAKSSSLSRANKRDPPAKRNIPRLEERPEANTDSRKRTASALRPNPVPQLFQCR